MVTLNLEATKTTPQIILNKTDGELKISGVSSPENAESFYAPVIAWLKAYEEDPNPTTKFIFDFSFINSSSTKAILAILSSLENLDQIEAIWKHQGDKTDILEFGQDIGELVDLDLSFQENG